MNKLTIILGLSTLFWGWQTHLLIIAIPLAIIIQSHQLFKQKWELSDTEFKTVSNLCVILLIILITYILFNNRSLYFIYTFFKWLPLVILPLLIAQLYSTRNSLNIALFFTFIKLEPNANTFNIDLRYIYLFLSIIAAGTVKNEGSGFYLGSIILVILIFFPLKNPRFSLATWLIFMILGSSLGYLGHLQLHQLHLTFEQIVIEQLSKFNQGFNNPFQTTTSLGDLGELKQDNSILLRVNKPANQPVPELLREATYNQYQDRIWLAANAHFKTIPSQLNQTVWILDNPNRQNSSKITISEKVNTGKGLLKLPNGAFKIGNLPANKVVENQYGAVSFESELKKVTYQIEFQENYNNDSPPTATDLLIPPLEKSALDKFLKPLDLSGKTDQEIANLIQTYFQNNFTYTLKLLGQKTGSTALASFLLENQSGHCEYFATATTLLLRNLGIPARYAIGYSVHEFSNLEQQYIVRSRHAHAWTMAYLNGSWQPLDTTPAIWKEMEDQNSNKLSFITDFLSFLGYQFSLIFDNLKNSDSFRKYWWLWISPLILFLFWRLNFTQFKPGLKISQNLQESELILEKQGLDSEFYLIEQALNQLGLIRDQSESLKQWLKQLENHLPDPLFTQLKLIIELHYRYRFDPQGITPQEKANFKSLIQSYLVMLKAIDNG